MSRPADHPPPARGGAQAPRRASVYVGAKTRERHHGMEFPRFEVRPYLLASLPDGLIPDGAYSVWLGQTSCTQSA
jgi:hypothetical protein